MCGKYLRKFTIFSRFRTLERKGSESVLGSVSFCQFHCHGIRIPFSIADPDPARSTENILGEHLCRLRRVMVFFLAVTNTSSTSFGIKIIFSTVKLFSSIDLC
jgi:hypothetical protein